MRLTELDYYAALEVLPGASLEQIQRAYRFQIQNYGPDSIATYGLLDEGERREIETFLNEAMRVLGNEQLRVRYNQELLNRGLYNDEQMRATGPQAPAEGGVELDLPMNLPAAVSHATPPAAPTDIPPPAEAAAAPVTPIPSEAKPLRERSWWPFTDKEKTAEPPARPAANAVGEDTAPLLEKPAPEVIPALDGRPIGGVELRQIREARGLRLEEISARTKISLSTLRAIEESTFKFLPAAVYVKGFLRTSAKLLQIDADKVIADYMRNFEAHKPV
jgi:curved DNA-binding protein CbpA